MEGGREGERREGSEQRDNARRPRQKLTKLL